VCTWLRDAIIKTLSHTSVWLYRCNVLLQTCLHVTNRLLELNRVVLPPPSDILSTEPITYAVNLSLPQLWLCSTLSITLKLFTIVYPLLCQKLENNEMNEVQKYCFNSVVFALYVDVEIIRSWQFRFICTRP
jgi:hypothetical protein